MDTKERREQIQMLLGKAKDPVSATALAKHFGVSRQIVVGDIALLRASGADISSTARGYLLLSSEKEKKQFGHIGIVACRHTNRELLPELYCVVDHGGCLIDVMIEHPIYGQLSGTLDIRSRFDADQFAAQVQAGHGTPLSALTDGIHLHHIGCRDEAAFHRIEAALDDQNILLK